MLPGGGIKIARIFGIEIDINPTWLLIFALVGFSLSEALRGARVSGHPGTFPGGVWPWVFGFGVALVFFACLLAHELSHSYVAKRKGINIRRITLFIFGGVAEMSEDVSDATSELEMAAAGPAMTFFLTGVFYLIYRLVSSDPTRGPLWIAPLFLLVYVNLFVGVFNLLPGFPLDGGRVFRAIIWKVTGNLQRATRIATYGGEVVGVLIAAGGIVFFFYSALLNGVWLFVIGGFIFLLARSSYQQTLLQLAVADTQVKDLMYTGIPIVDEDTTLTDLRNHYFTTYHLPALPVAHHDGSIFGMVSRDDLATVNPSEWDVLNAGRVAHELTAEQIIGPEEKLNKVMRRVMRADQFLLVMDDGKVQGLLTADELMRYIKARSSAAPPGGGAAGPQ